MDERYLLATVRYVERNPVAARLCLRPQQWRWSSARAHLAGVDDELVQVKPMLDRINDWPAYIDQPADKAEIDDLRKHTRTGRPLGNAVFVDRLELLLGKTLRPQKRGPKTGGS
jgi:putative transposase